MEAYARHHRIPIHWPDPNLNKKDLKKEDFVRPYGLAMERRKRFGVSFIFKSLEQDPTFGSLLPKYPTGDPDYRILKRQRSPCTHYFYIRDEVLGPMALCVGSPLSNHRFHPRSISSIRREGVRFRKDDNGFLWTENPPALQASADRRSPEVIRQRLDYGTLVRGPKFSKKDRSAAIRWRREYSLHRVEYGRHFILRRNFPIPKIFERCGELGLCRLTADQITPILGVRQHRRLRGRLHRMREHGHPVRRLYGKSLVARVYEKLAIWLRLEICVHRLRDLGLHQGLENLHVMAPEAGSGDGSADQFGGRTAPRPRGLPAVPAPCPTHPLRPQPNPGHSNPGHPEDAPPGGLTPRRPPNWVAGGAPRCRRRLGAPSPCPRKPTR